jgi:hypothetical protein
VVSTALSGVSWPGPGSDRVGRGARREGPSLPDSPYLGRTRESGRAAKHEELAATLLPEGVVLSGCRSPLYADWQHVEIPTSTGQGGSRQACVEVLWSNRPSGHPRLFDCRRRRRTLHTARRASGPENAGTRHPGYLPRHPTA